MFIAIAAISMTLSIVMSGIAWRLTSEERRRSRARVTTLASDLAEIESRLPTAAAGGAGLFSAQEPAEARSRFVVIVAIGGFAAATAIALIVMTSRTIRSASPVVAPHASPAAPGSPATGPRSPSATESAPLELMALGDELEGDRIIIRGVVRNPTTGVKRDRVAVAIFLFNRDGGFLSSSLASIEVPTLAPGSQSDFIVTAPHANEVGRYRVSFRGADRIVPHVDRRDRGSRGQLP